MSRALKKPGFATGFSSLLGAVRFLAKDPGTWPVALVPTLVFAVLGALGAYAGIHWLTPRAADMLGLAEPGNWYETAGSWLVSLLVALLSAVAGFFGAFVLTPPLSSPALEHLVTEQEAALGIEPRDKLSFLSEIGCGLRAQFFGVALATPMLIGLWLLMTLFPPLAFVIMPLKLMVVALGLAWNLFDYPLTLRGVGSGDRIGFMFSNLPCVLGFGLAFSALFWVPCFGVVMLPVGAVAATRLVWTMLDAAPFELPSLPRPTRLQLGALSSAGEAPEKARVEKPAS